MPENVETSDVVLMIDVIYYEPNISDLWSFVASLVDTQGLLILRVPNKYLPILFMEKLKRLLTNGSSHSMRTSINFFNPEHIYIFTKKYLRMRLKSLGFSSVAFFPSPSLARKEGKSYFAHAYYYAARTLERLSLGVLTVSASLVVVAKR